jgi:Tfp pilus assembly protein PilF
VVVRDGREEWEPETGQRPLPYRDYERFESFRVADLAQRAAPVARRAAAEASRRDDLSAEDWYELGYELEATSAEDARNAYRRAVALDPSHADAHLNLGRLLHEGGDASAAERHYRQAAAHRPADATAHFNLGVALQDQDRPAEAQAAYELALALDPAYADAHFNLAGLKDAQGDRLAALRHLKEYRALTRSR